MKKINKDSAAYIITVVLSLVLIFTGYRAIYPKIDGVANEATSFKAKIVRLGEVEEMQMNVGTDTYNYKIIYFSARVLSGAQKGQTVDAAQIIDELYVIQQDEVKEGKKVLLCENADSNVNARYTFSEYVRTDALIVLGVVFCVLVVLFGGFKGVSTLLSLALTCMAVFLIFVPSVLAGMNVYFWSILVCVYITAMTLILVNGLNAKSLAAATGCVGGVVVSGALMLFMNIFLVLTGNTDEHSIYLAQINPDRPINLKALIFAAIIIGAVGAIMDVAMSMASSLHELSEKNAKLTAKELFASGLSIGRDIMGTMANTLVLAYIGSSLCTVLLLFVYDASFMEIMNRELIITEILQALVGSFGILFAIPLTAGVSALLYTGTRPRKSEKVHSAQNVKKSRLPESGTSADDYYNSLF